MKFIFKQYMIQIQNKSAIYNSSNPRDNNSSNSTPGSARKVHRSIVMQFKNQLSNLIDHINSTIPHYIRCIKPYDKNEIIYIQFQISTLCHETRPKFD
jgi:myosin heavy subunit